MTQSYVEKVFPKMIKNAQEVKPGASMGAMFIKQFIRYPKNWVHLDIAYSSFDEKKKKATGAPIKSLVRFIKGINK